MILIFPRAALGLHKQIDLLYDNITEAEEEVYLRLLIATCLITYEGMLYNL